MFDAPATDGLRSSEPRHRLSMAQGPTAAGRSRGYPMTLDKQIARGLALVPAAFLGAREEAQPRQGSFLGPGAGEPSASSMLQIHCIKPSCDWVAP
jgi:hypothetical protein